ncbi:LPS assembly lipoprotein LptE [Nereida sp. MMG025]|uniref:LPS assembly lipoprotein LptE n=1 Tax=Nereida sp. MMG025 TaxID=2909981 RepID=UPI001EFF9B72|nr:LPS assembly lipoprotein LptE [Nereida sp. MMG025]MCF6444777.1 LPS assembly lipoprotein LptE [Nereida sp. MMG025]
MSLFDRRAVLTGALALVAGCGFRPVLDSEVPFRGAVRFFDPKTRTDFVLRNALEDRIGTPNAPRYALSISTVISEDGIAITSDQVTTQFNVIGKVDYTLRDLTTDAVVSQGSVDNFTSYSTTGTTVATETAERDAIDRLMVILADQITARLLVSLA